MFCFWFGDAGKMSVDVGVPDACGAARARARVGQHGQNAVALDNRRVAHGTR